MSIVRDITGGGALEIASDAVLGDGCRFHITGATVRIGPGARLGDRVVVLAHAGIEIGAGAVLGDDVVLVDFGHRTDRVDVPIRHQPLDTSPIFIGEGAVIGHRAIIERGVTVLPGTRVQETTVLRTLES